MSTRSGYFPGQNIEISSLFYQLKKCSLNNPSLYYYFSYISKFENFLIIALRIWIDEMPSKSRWRWKLRKYNVKNKVKKKSKLNEFRITDKINNRHTNHSRRAPSNKTKNIKSKKRNFERQKLNENKLNKRTKFFNNFSLTNGIIFFFGDFGIEHYWCPMICYTLKIGILHL